MTRVTRCIGTATKNKRDNRKNNKRPNHRKNNTPAACLLGLGALSYITSGSNEPLHLPQNKFGGPSDYPSVVAVATMSTVIQTCWVVIREARLEHFVLAHSASYCGPFLGGQLTFSYLVGRQQRHFSAGLT